MRVLTFSRTFPAYHPRRGEPTFFVEKILESMTIENWDMEREFDPRLSLDFFAPKHHTIRAGHRWKVGDWFSPRVWSGKPYASKQIAFAPPIQVVGIHKFNIKKHDETAIIFLDQVEMAADTVGILAGNDGLSFVDFIHWFKWPSEFSGQMIIWDKEINYGDYDE